MRDGRGSGLRRRAAVTAAAVGEAPIPTTLGVRSIPSPVPGAGGRVRLGTLTHQTAFLTGGARPLDLQVVDFGAG